MRIALITDAWHPQINGIVTTIRNTYRALEKLGHTVELISPNGFRTWPCPGYPDVRLAFLCGPKLRPIIKAFKPDAIHFFTEGAVGCAARRYCRHMGFEYTTSYHSHFGEYLKLRIGFPLLISNTYLRWFHCKSRRVMVSTNSLKDELAAKGFKNLTHWSRGVDIDLFKPRQEKLINHQRPIMMYTGRIAIEKNVEDFLELDIPGTKYVVGDGPQRQILEKKYPDAKFVGYKTGEELARYMAAADAFVFPSRTDTFGLVILEALACGTPVAAYPVQGPKDILTNENIGVLDNDLNQATRKALTLSRQECRRFALDYSWENCARQFVENLTPMRRISINR